MEYKQKVQAIKFCQVQSKKPRNNAFSNCHRPLFFTKSIRNCTTSVVSSLFTKNVPSRNNTPPNAIALSPLLHSLSDDASSLESLPLLLLLLLESEHNNCTLVPNGAITRLTKLGLSIQNNYKFTQFCYLNQQSKCVFVYLCICIYLAGKDRTTKKIEK